MLVIDVKNEVLEVLSSYWRIRASLAYLRSKPETLAIGDLGLRLVVPEYGITAGAIAMTNVGDSVKALEGFESSRLQNDIFLAMISRLEAFLADIVQRAGTTTDHLTFGDLLREAQNAYGIPSCGEVLRLRELRARRNAIVHHHGAVTPEYQRVAPVVVPISGGHVVNPATLTDVHVTPPYLSYAADALTVYAARFGGCAARNGAVVS